ncbi:MAG: hypothetical protein DWQ07_19955 [Chloroflexi bacterium]|nr:MAG: hypothetical protein DWQ07_19955 [Chloroflexota bacterium]MBL1194358.1 hypothetical protein [Chloroflexota bacterium]NOH11646.1 hypothetical protein [Chloroflexota bacterium]
MGRIQEIGRFVAQSDSGQEYTIVQYQEFIDAGARDDPNAEVPGLKSMKTTTGLHVNYIDSDTFKIVPTGEVVRRVG